MESKYNGPCTGIFGRSYEQISYLCNTWKNENEEIQKPRIVDVYENRKDNALKIADIGCGGCADHHLWEKTIKKTLKEYGVENPEIEILGVDINEEMFEDILNGEFDYTQKIDSLPGDSKEDLYKILDECFEKKDDLFSYEMKKEYTKELNLVLGDAYNLNFEDDSFDIVVSNFLLYHLDEHFKNKNRKKVFNELTRIVKEGGLIFTEAGFFEKKGYYKVEERDEPPYVKMKNGELEPIRKKYYDYGLGKGNDVGVGLKLCDKSPSGSEYISNDPLMEKLEELIEEGDRIAIVGTGNNEIYPIDVFERLKKKGISHGLIKAIDPEFDGVRKYKDKNIVICPRTYQEELGLEGKSSDMIDFVNNMINEKTRVIGMEICNHQKKDISKIENMLRENGYSIDKIYENIIVAYIEKTKEIDEKNYQKPILNIDELNDCKNHWEKRFFEG